MENFKTIRNRRNDRSYKWMEMEQNAPNHGVDAFPFTVADVDMYHPKALTEGLKAYLDDMVFGYTAPSILYYEAVISWYQRRHQWELKQDWILQAPGVVVAINHALKAFTKEGDGVMIMSPVYYPFKRSIENLKRKVVETTLVEVDDVIVIDFQDFEAKAADANTKVLLLCSPHNPVGRVWSEHELKQIEAICDKYDVLVFSDEIHGDLIMPGYRFIPYATLSKKARHHSITFVSSSKSFNLAGLHNAHVIIPSQSLRNQYQDSVTQDGGSLNTNVLGLAATQIAYTQCESWFDEFVCLIAANHQLVKSFIARENIPIRVCSLEGTYLQWLDFRDSGLAEAELIEKLQEHDVFLSPGSKFGESGQGFMRMNLACPQSILKAGLKRIQSAIQE
ncbi:MalY/PatB family protein [Erysipelothrix sp. P66]|uniref:MalY/PatB family protein n=1 Tax=Erysipelothrix sp. P66 TaxID=3141531 RepID=UPI00315CD427